MIFDKLSSAFGMLSTFKNWPVVVSDHLGIRSKPYTTNLRKDLKFVTRPGTDDGRILFEVFSKQCYRPTCIRKGGTVIDIGANIGAFSILAAQRGAAVYAYEPHPTNLMQLEANCKLNGFNDIRINPVCVAAKAGHAALYVPDNDGFVGRFSLYPGRGSRTVEVPVISAKMMFAEMPAGPIDCLKIDCQGSEYEILYEAGAENLKRVQEILVECEPFPTDQPSYTVPALSDYLTNLGFRIDGTQHIIHARRE